MKKILFIITIACTLSTASAQSLFSKLYCSVLGNEDVKREHKKLIHRALYDFGVDHYAAVSVKKMNALGPLIAGMPLSSFTAHGIWIDESYFDALVDSKKEFHAYHEAAHYAHKHHQKLVGTMSVVSVISGIALVCLHKILKANKLTHATPLTVGAAALTVYALCAKLLPYLVQHQEKEADIEAAHLLRDIHKESVVEDHIHSLENSLHNNDLAWWLEHKEQLAYLRATTTP
jgi:hypothetical protein